MPWNTTAAQGGTILRPGVPNWDHAVLTTDLPPSSHSHVISSHSHLISTPTAILSSPDSESRLQTATTIFLKQASISEVSRKIASAVDESLSKQQKEFFLRQQLAAIQRELHALNKTNNNSGNPNSGTTVKPYLVPKWTTNARSKNLQSRPAQGRASWTMTSSTKRTTLRT